MTILCITGAPIPALQQLANLLQHGGMAPAVGLDRKPSLTLQDWHEHVLARTDGLYPCDPGRLWDQLAAELFLININTPLWGWADHRSVPLLNYWIEFEPGLRFVLLCETPQQAVARSIVQQGNERDVELVLAEWAAIHQAILRFHLRNTQRSELLWAQAAILEPAATLQLISKKWALPLDNAGVALDPVPADTVIGLELAQYLADEVTAGFPEVTSLLQELEACTGPLRPNPETGDVGAPSARNIAALIKSFRALANEQHAADTLRADVKMLSMQASNARLEANRVEELEHQLALTVATANQLKEAVCQLTTAKTELAQQNTDLSTALEAENLTSTRLQEELRSAVSEASSLSQQLRQVNSALECEAIARVEIEARFAALDKERAFERDARTRAEGVLHEAQQEANLLLGQLHQAQEQLEIYFTQLTDNEKKLAELTQNYTQATKSKEELLSQRNALLEEKQSLISARDSIASEKCQLALLLEAETHIKSEALTQRDLLAKEKQTLIAARDKLEAENQQLAALLESKKQSKGEILDQRNSLAGENASLAEEFRALGLNNEQLMRSLETESRVRAEAVAQRDDFAREKLALTSELQGARDESKLLLVQLQQAQEELEAHHHKQQALEEQIKAAASRWRRMLQRNPEYCEFESIQAVTGPTEQPGKTVWKVASLEAAGRHFEQLEFFTVTEQGIAGIGIERKSDMAEPLLRWPAATKKNGQLLALPVGDVEALKSQLNLISELSTTDWDLLQSLPKILLMQAGNIGDDLVKSLYKHRQLLSKMPVALRFDTVKLLRQQTNADYEHLWLRLGNVSFANERWPSFEFRLACAKANGLPFGQQPKLEFPTAARSVLKSWHEESDDDFGPKMELRFALPNSMDMQVWSRLSNFDHQLVITLLSILPNILALLHGSGASTQRSIQEWQTMSVHMLRALRKLLLSASFAKSAPSVTTEEQPAADTVNESSIQLEAPANTQEKLARTVAATARKRPANSKKSATKVELS